MAGSNVAVNAAEAYDFMTQVKSFFDSWKNYVVADFLNRYSKVVTVAKSGADYSTLGAAVVAATPSSTARYAILVYGDGVTETASVEMKSYIDIFGLDADVTLTPTTGNYGGIFYQNLVESRVTNITFRTAASSVTYEYVLGVLGTTDDTVIFQNCKFISGNTSATSAVVAVWNTAHPKFFNCEGVGHSGNVNNNQGLLVSNTAYPYFADCIFRAGTGTGTNKTGITLDTACYPTLVNCFGYGGSGGTDVSRGIYIANETVEATAGRTTIIGGRYEGGAGTNGHGILVGTRAAPFIWAAKGVGGSGTLACGIVFEDTAAGTCNDCIGMGGTSTTDPSYNGLNGLQIVGSATPVINNFSAQGGENAINAPAVYLGGNASPVINGLIATPYRRTFVWTYDDANSGRFQPFASKPYQLVGINVDVIVANVGKTLDIGTAAAGTQVASAVALGTVGAVFFAFTRVEVAADGYLYATPSAAIADGDVKIEYVVITNNAGCYALYHYGNGDFSRINNSIFQSNGASDSVYITNNTPLNWKFSHCLIETFDTTNQKSINAGAAITSAPFYLCSLVGNTNNITSYATQTLGGLLDHGVALTGLTDDDHTQYLLADGTRTLTGDNLLGENAGLKLDAALSADGKYCGITEAGTAGAVLAFGDLVYLAVADSRWELCDASASATAFGKIGICVLVAAGDGSATTILLWGKVRADAVFPALTVGAPVFMSETAGDITMTAPVTAASITRIMGYGNTADELFFCPENTYVEHV